MSRIIKSYPDELIKPQFALVSVDDKTNLRRLGEELKARFIDIISTGRTLKELESAGVPVTEIGTYSGQRELLDGSVRTLTSHVHWGLSANMRNDEHINEMMGRYIRKIDLLVANMPSIEKTMDEGLSGIDFMKKLDVGGHAMIRSGAKNCEFTTVITDPNDYDRLFGELDKNDGCTSEKFRELLAIKAFKATAAYDVAISEYLGKSK